MKDGHPKKAKLDVLQEKIKKISANVNARRRLKELDELLAGANTDQKSSVAKNKITKAIDKGAMALQSAAYVQDQYLLAQISAKLGNIYFKLLPDDVKNFQKAQNYYSIVTKIATEIDADGMCAEQWFTDAKREAVELEEALTDLQRASLIEDN